MFIRLKNLLGLIAAIVVLAASSVSAENSSAESVVFFEDFEQEKTGSIPSRWRLIGRSAVIEEEKGKKNKVLRTRNTVVYCDSFSWDKIHKDKAQKYLITLKFKIQDLGISSWDGLGLYLLSDNTKDGCLITIRKDKTIKIKRLNTNLNLISENFSAGTDAWHQLKVMLTEKYIKVWIDNYPYLDYEHDFDMHGKMGLNFLGKSSGFFDNIRIEVHGDALI